MSADQRTCARCGARRKQLTAWTRADVVALKAAGKWISRGMVRHDGTWGELLQDACGNPALIVDLPPGYWLNPRTGEVVAAS
jgi:hypothetical protein